MIYCLCHTKINCATLMSNFCPFLFNSWQFNVNRVLFGCISIMFSNASYKADSTNSKHLARTSAHDQGPLHSVIHTPFRYHRHTEQWQRNDQQPSRIWSHKHKDHHTPHNTKLVPSMSRSVCVCTWFGIALICGGLTMTVLSLIHTSLPCDLPVRIKTQNRKSHLEFWKCYPLFWAMRQ